MFSNIRLLGLTKFHDTILFCTAVSDTEGDCLIETPDADDIVHVIETVHDNLLPRIHISEPTTQAESSYAAFCLKKNTLNASDP